MRSASSPNGFPGPTATTRGRGHMVGAIEGPVPLAQVRAELQAAHDYLAEAARGAVVQLGGGALETWGADVKRVRVCLIGPPPPRVSERAHHNFVEVVNQCATLERLIDALGWAETAMPGYVVKSCHPTTSSTTNAHDHDLVLVNAAGEPDARFEVSDILSGTVKEKNDLRTLGVLATRGGTNAWPDARLFLVVSVEMAERVCNSKRPLPRSAGFRYALHDHTNATRTGILEVIRCGRE